MRQKYLSTEKQNQHLDFLIDPCFEGVNRISVSSFEIKAIGKYTQDIIFQKYKWKITTLWLMEKNFFDQPVKSDTRFTKSQQVKEMITQLVVC